MSGIFKQLTNLYIDLVDRLVDQVILVSKQTWSFMVCAPLYLVQTLQYVAQLLYHAFQEAVTTTRFIILVLAVYSALVPLAYWSATVAIFVTIWLTLFGPKLKPVFTPPKVLQGDSYGKHKYALLPGVNLHYVDNGKTDKPILIFLHGFSEFWYTWRNQIDHFSIQNDFYRTIAVDMRGFGDSDKPVSVMCYKLDTLIEDLKNLIQHLNPEKKTECYVVAHGWGAVVLYCFLLKYGDLISAYVTLNVVPPYVIKLSFRQIIDAWRVYLYHVPIVAIAYIRSYLPLFLHRTYDAVPDSETVIKAYTYTLNKPGAYVFPLNYFRANLLTLVQYRLSGAQDLIMGRLPPGLCLYGNKDETMDENSFKYVDFVPNLQRTKVLGGGRKMAELQPDTINLLIKLFFDRLVKIDMPKALTSRKVTRPGGVV